MQLQIEIMKYTLLKLASKASKRQGDKEQIMKSLCSRVKHGASALCRCISSAAFSHWFHIRQTSRMLLRRPSGGCLSTATCTQFCWVGRGPAQEQKRSSCACSVPLAAPSHSDSAALRLCSSVSLRQALAAFASEQSLLFWSAETPECEYKRGRIAGSASLKKKKR